MIWLKDKLIRRESQFPEMKCNKEFTSSERSLGGTLHQVSKAVWVQGQMNAFATEATERIAGEVGVFLRDVRKAAKQKGGQKKNATGA